MENNSSLLKKTNKNIKNIRNLIIIFFVSIFFTWFFKDDKVFGTLGVFVILITLFLFVILSIKNAILQSKVQNKTELKQNFDYQQAILSNDKEKLRNFAHVNNFERADAKDNTKYLVLDVETTGLPAKRGFPPECTDLHPYIVEVAFYQFNEKFELINDFSSLIKIPISMPFEASIKNGIKDEILLSDGKEPLEVYTLLAEIIKKTEYVVSHNAWFDIPIIESNFVRYGFSRQFLQKKIICTMLGTIDFCKIPRNQYKNNSEYKYPKLDELVSKCFGFYPYHGLLHRADSDTILTAKCFKHLLALGKIDLDKTIKIPTQIQDHVFFGKKIVLSGFDKKDSQEIERIICNIGGQIQENVTKETSFLIATFEAMSLNPSIKMKKAESMKEKGHNIVIIKDTDLNDYIGRYNFTYL